MRVDKNFQSYNSEILKNIKGAFEGIEVKNLEKIRKEVQENTKEIQKISNEELKKIIEEIRKKLDYLNKYLKIEIDQDLEIPIVKILEKETNRVIRQIPPEYLLELMKKIDQLLGILIDERV